MLERISEYGLPASSAILRVSSWAAMSRTRRRRLSSTANRVSRKACSISLLIRSMSIPFLADVKWTRPGPAFRAFSHGLSSTALGACCLR
jgi:hypothetical protein